MPVAFSLSGSSFVITDSVSGITYSSNNPLQFKIVGNTIQVVASNLGGSGNPSVIGSYALADITTIGGNAVAGTLAGAIAQLNAILPEAAIYDKLPQKTALNAVTPISADAVNVRPYEFDLLVAQGRITGHTWQLKSGRNPNVSTGTVPEDIWNGGGVYTGFPLASPEVVTVLSSNAGDTGTLTITYLPTATSTAYVTGTVTLNGITPVDCAFSAYRIHSAFYNTTASDLTGNVGEITVRWKVTTSVIFLKMPVGTNQTYNAGFTIPFGCTSFFYEVFASIQGGSASAVDGAIWIRLSGQSFRLRRNWSCTHDAPYRENLAGEFTLPALTDIHMRVTNCNTNNTPVIAGYTLLIIQQ